MKETCVSSKTNEESRGASARADGPARGNEEILDEAAPKVLLYFSDELW